jgi:hypothetical protein
VWHELGALTEVEKSLGSGLSVHMRAQTVELKDRDDIPLLLANKK